MNLQFFRYTLIFLFLGCTPHRGICQGYVPKEASFFRVGDSVRVDTEFIFDKLVMDSLGAPASADLSWLRNFLIAHEMMQVSINVHTDTRGSYEKNLQRSEKRAAGITTWLLSEGISADRFTVKGWGEMHPIVSERIIDAYLRTDRSKFDSLHRINERITIQITKVQQRVKCNYRSAGDTTLNKYYREVSDRFDVNDRFRLDFISVHERPVVTDFTKENYLELVAFIRCNPGVVFGVSVHCAENEDYFQDRLTTKEQAQEIVELLVNYYGLSPNQLLAIGAGSDQPIIPDLVMDELSENSEQKEKYDKINTRVELVIAEIGAGK